MHTAIYARVSTEEQANEGFSIHAQKDKLTKYAEVNDWIITDYYVDDGISGKNLTERPEVTRLIEDVKSGKINNVLVYKLDRLTTLVKGDSCNNFESVEDTLLDLANYAIMFRIHLEDLHDEKVD